MAAAKADNHAGSFLPFVCARNGGSFRLNATSPFQVRPLFQSETCRTGGWKFQDPDGNAAFIQFQLDVNS